MTTIRSICVDCGDIDVSIDHISIERTTDTRRSVYVFACPSCGTSYRRPASPQVVEALLAMGAIQRHIAFAEPITQQEIDEFVASLDVDPRSDEIESDD